MKRICKKAAYPLHCFIETTEKHSFYVEKHLKKRTSNRFKCYFYTIDKKHQQFHMKSMNKSFLGASIILAVLSGCASKQAQQPELTLSGLNPANFEVSAENTKPIKLYTLKNNQGMEVCVTNFGGRIVSIMVPDKNGKMTDVVLGFDSIADYQNIPSDFGASIGRYANRINKGKITIDGQEIQLPTNNFGHCLHGGPTGWQYQVYEANQANDSTIVLTMKTPEGDNNIPGFLLATVTYSLTADNAIDIKYDATTDKTTVINMTNHSYFNLNGDPSKPATDHLLYVASDSITPVDSTFMTTGEIAPVEGTPIDIRELRPVAPGMEADDPQIKQARGYDHCLCIDGYQYGRNLRRAMHVEEMWTGRELDYYTTAPGEQLYTGNWQGDEHAKDDANYGWGAGFALEAEMYPDTPHQPLFPQGIVGPGHPYSNVIEYHFMRH